ncbi:MAG TPA: hypothetical protein VF364_03125, partial [Candidatus Limnocylindria bacterium]
MHTPTDDQRRRFEQLCMLRSLYALRGSADAESVMDVASAIRYGEALLRDAAVRDAGQREDRVAHA